MVTPSGRGEINRLKDITGKVPSNRVITNQRVTGGSSNTFRVSDPKENAAPSAKGNGVGRSNTRKSTCSDNTPKQGKNAISLYGKDAHKRASKMLGYALTVGDFPAWEAASAIWAARLTVQERIALAFMALGSLDDDNAQMAAEAALFGITREAR
jgi:hypothetical protein